MAAGPGRASRQHVNQAPPVWRAPEGPEGTGGLRRTAPNDVRSPSLAGGRALRRPQHPWGHKQPDPKVSQRAYETGAASAGGDHQKFETAITTARPSTATIETDNTDATEKRTKYTHFSPAKAAAVSTEARPARAKATAVSDNHTPGSRAPAAPPAAPMRPPLRKLACNSIG